MPKRTIILQVEGQHERYRVVVERFNVHRGRIIEVDERAGRTILGVACGNDGKAHSLTDASPVFLTDGVSVYPGCLVTHAGQQWAIQYTDSRPIAVPAEVLTIS